MDYAAVGPEHAALYELGRVQYVSVTDKEALAAFQKLTREEGILPALESSHALAYAFKKARDMKENSVLLVNLSGRGDKDLDIVEAAMKEDSHV
jgi:tryptophan synthase beta chain